MKEDLPPIRPEPGRRVEVEAMFDDIAPRYDFMNRALSLGIDRMWRKRAIELLRPFHPENILDVATGTADLALDALKLNPELVTGLDVSEKMLELGRQKVASHGESERIKLIEGAAEDMPFSTNEFDAALVAFGVRNFEDLGRGLEEFQRVLRSGAPLVVLEFSHPTVFPVKQLYNLYFRFVVPTAGRLLARTDAYQYLFDSVGAFPSGDDFLSLMEGAGFKELRAVSLSFGIASLYLGIAG